METYCANCGDRFTRVEYNSEGVFCSTDCEEKWSAAEEDLAVYNEARYGGATTLN